MIQQQRQRRLNFRRILGRVRIVATIAVLVAAAHPANTAQLNLAAANKTPPLSGRTLPEGGLATAIVRAAWAKTDMDVRIVYRPNKRARLRTRAAHFSATFPFKKQPPTSQWLTSDPILVYHQRLMIHADFDTRIESFADMAGLTLCQPINQTEPAWLTAIRERVHIARAPNVNSCLRMLKFNRVDAVAGAPIVLRTKARNLFDTTNSFQFAKLRVAHTRIRLLIPRALSNAHELAARFDESLRALRRSGEHQAIVQRHLGTATPFLGRHACPPVAASKTHSSHSAY